MLKNNSVLLSLDDTRQLQDSILTFPTTNQLVLDTTLKDMLVFLRSTTYADILSLVQKFKFDIHEVSDRVCWEQNGRLRLRSTT